MAHKGGHRSTQAELQEREDFAYMLLSRCLLKSQVKAQLRKKFGDGLHHSTIEEYIRRARDRMLVEANRGKDVFRAESLAFYHAMLLDSNATINEKINARARIDRILGVDAPVKTEHTGANGGPIEIDVKSLSDEELERIVKAK